MIFTWSSLLISYLHVMFCSGRTTADINEHIRLMAEKENVDGFSIGAVSVFVANAENKKILTKRSVESFKDESPSDPFLIELSLTSGEQMRMSMKKNAMLDKSAMNVIVDTATGEATIEIENLDCFYRSQFKEGYGNLALCDGRLMGTLITSERSYELFPIPEMLKKSRQSELEKVIVLWRNNNFNVSEIATSNYRRQTEFDQFTFGNDGMEIPLDEDGNITNADTARKRSIASRTVTVEIGNYLDKYYIDDLRQKTGTSTNKQLVAWQLAKYETVGRMLGAFNHMLKHCEQ